MFSSIFQSLLFHENNQQTQALCVNPNPCRGYYFNAQGFQSLSASEKPQKQFEERYAPCYFVE